MSTALLYDFIAIKRAGRHGHALARAALTHDPHGKLVWFSQEPFFNALNTFSLNPAVNVFSMAFNLRQTWAAYARYANACDAAMLAAALLTGAWLYFGRRAPGPGPAAACGLPHPRRLRAEPAGGGELGQLPDH
jgi:hypothetical protein